MAIAISGMDVPATTFRRGPMRAGLLASFLFFSLYLLFAGSVSVSETLTGAVLAGVSGAAAALLIRTSTRHFAMSMQHAGPWSRAILGLPRATLRTGQALAAVLLGRSPPKGVAATSPFHTGDRDDPVARARRVTAVLAMSLSPNAFVVEISPQRGEVLLHGLGSNPSASNPEWLV